MTSGGCLVFLRFFLCYFCPSFVFSPKLKIAMLRVVFLLSNMTRDLAVVLFVAINFSVLRNGLVKGHYKLHFFKIFL